MKYFSSYLVLSGTRLSLVIGLALTSLVAWTQPATAQSPTHFVNCVENTRHNATIIVLVTAAITTGRDSIALGDEIAVFNTSDRCVGAITWTGNAVSLTVWGADQSTRNSAGLQPGERMLFRVWDASEQRELGGNNAFTLTLSDEEPYLTATNRYVPDGIYRIVSLSLNPKAQASR